MLSNINQIEERDHCKRSIRHPSYIHPFHICAQGLIIIHDLFSPWIRFFDLVIYERQVCGLYFPYLELT